MDGENEKIYLLTDGCMWQINEETGNEHPHAVEVVDLETGAVRYIRSGSRIRFVEGDITDIRTQKTYREGQEAQRAEIQEAETVPCHGQDMPDRVGGKVAGKKRKGVAPGV